MSTLVELDQVTVTMQHARALNSVSLMLRKGEHTVLQGPNGSGKSTLLRLVRGDIHPDQRNGGQVIWHTPQGPETSPLVGQSMSALVSTAQLETYVSKGWRISGETLLLTGFADTPLLYADPTPAQRETVRALGARLKISPLLDRELPTLSHGQVRILLLARACIRKPAILLLDEFTDGLDVQTRSRVLDMLDMLAESSTLLAVAHRVDTLPTCIARAVRLEAGKILEDGPLRTEESTRDAHRTVRVCASDGPPLIDIANADVYVDETHVLHGLNWRINQGENWAVIGHNGAGKTTLLRLLAGLENVAFGGHIQRRLPSQGEEVIVELDRLRRGIGIVSDRLQATYWYDLSGEELVFSGFERSVGLFRDINAAEREEAYAWMQRLGVMHLAKRHMRSMSTGQLRKLLLARAVMGKPDLLLLDEPCSGLDVESREHLLRIFDELAAGGTHLVLVTHHESDIMASITHVAYLEQGRMTRQGAR